MIEFFDFCFDFNFYDIIGVELFCVLIILCKLLRLINKYLFGLFYFKICFLNIFFFIIIEFDYVKEI